MCIDWAQIFRIHALFKTVSFVLYIQCVTLQLPHVLLSLQVYVSWVLDAIST